MNAASMLFVPGNAPDKYRKARQSEAGSLILDLEDSVPRGGKDDARRAVVEMLRAPPGPQALWVRVNALSTGLLLQDLAAVVGMRPFGIVLPKCCGRETLAPVVHYLDAMEAAAGVAAGSTRILAIATETASSVFRLSEYAGLTERLWGLTWGAEDLAADVGAISNQADDGHADPYRLVRSLCLFGAAAAGVRPIDTVCTSLHDVASVRREAAEAFRDGFVGKMAIHPAQLAPINEAFVASAAQLDWARRVVAAFDSQSDKGALNIDGRMVDEPHLKLARRLLAGAA